MMDWAFWALAAYSGIGTAAVLAIGWHKYRKVDKAEKAFWADYDYERRTYTDDAPWPIRLPQDREGE